MRWATFGLVVVLVPPLATAARPQQGSSSNEQESVADIARRAQAQKKNQPQATKVWDNDSIPTTNGNISVVGQAGQAEGGPAPSTPPAAAQKTGGPATPEQKAAMQTDLNQAKAQLESLKADLDIAQRKYALDQQTYLSNPNYVDKTGAQTLEDEKEQIAAKQQEIAAMQKKVEDLQAQVEAANSGAAK